MSGLILHEAKGPKAPSRVARAIYPPMRGQKAEPNLRRISRGNNIDFPKLNKQIFTGQKHKIINQIPNYQAKTLNFRPKTLILM